MAGPQKSNLTKQLQASLGQSQPTTSDRTGTSSLMPGTSSAPEPRRASFNIGPGTTPPVQNIPPPRFGSPAAGLSQSQSQSYTADRGRRPSQGQALRRNYSGAGTESPNPEEAVNVEDIPTERKAEIVRRHLVSREERDSAAAATGLNGGRRPSEPLGYGAMDRRPTPESDRHKSTPSSYKPGLHTPEDSEPFPVEFANEGSDITHGIYKWQSRATLRRPRSASFSHPNLASPADPALEHIRQPGGMRRAFVISKAKQQGVEKPPMVNNFIDFLLLWGHFAGEDLDEEDELLEDDAEAGPSDGLLYPEGAENGMPTSPAQATERTRLIRSTSVMRDGRKRSLSIVRAGDATVTQAVLMLLKSFVGTGILFLGKAFFNGGILFSSCILVFIALISLYSFLLLVKTRFVVAGGFGEMGGMLYGEWMRKLILASIVISQLGFVSAYLIFVAENLQAFILAVSNCRTFIPVQYLIFSELLVFLPLAMIRNLAKLSSTALIADVFILIGLVYIASNEIGVIAERGVADVKLFNSRDFPLLIGTAVFSFEGIGLVIPITESMREPRKFPPVLTGVMLTLMVLFGGAGALAYAAYGADIQTVVIVNLPQDRKFVQVVQFLYSVAILLSTPLQLFPALRILENGIWTRSGKQDPVVKWQKNGFRLCIVLCCTVVSWLGAADLDKFVSFIGSFACVPLCYVYPAMLHYKAVAKTRWQRWSDLTLIIFGMAAAAYTTVQTVRLMTLPSSAPEFGRCSPAEPSGANRWL